MSSATFRRIVWKECRAQISLWLALVLGALLLQVMVLVATHGVLGALQPVAGVTFVLTACFAVACLALLFAGESEEGTRDWLLQLPIRPVTLIGAKLTFALLAVATFFVATCATGFMAVALSGKSAADLSGLDLSEWRFVSVVGLTAWALLFSLRGRRVLFVLLGAVIAEIVTVPVIENMYGPAMNPYFGTPQTMDTVRTLTYFAVVSIVLMIDLVLALRWAHAGGGAASAVVAPWRRRALSLPWSQRRENAWLRLVAWAARRGSPAARETAVLVWREARAAAPFAVGWLLLGFLVTDVLSIGSQQGQVLYARPFQLAYLIATPAVCGLLTCLGDQRQQAFRFLGERGASPVRVWWVKQSVWLLAAIVLTIACIRWDAAATVDIARGQTQNVNLFMQAIYLVHVPTVERHPGGLYPGGAEDWALRRTVVTSLIVSLFAAGQCASFWVRRAILAFGVMLIAVPAIVAWHAVLVAMDIPLGLSSWPLTLALLAATLCSAGAWLRGRDSWRLQFIRLAAVALPVVAVTAAAAAHRAYSVPTPGFSQDIAEALRSRERTFDTFDTYWSNRWRSVIRPFEKGDSYVKGWSIPADRRQALRQSLIELSEDIPAAYGRLDPLIYSPDSPLFVQWIGEFLANPGLENADGTPDTSADTIDEQWRACQAGLRITAYLSQECQSSQHWMECVRARDPLWRRISDWAARPDQTPEALQRAFDVLTADVRTPLGARGMTINRHVFYSQLLEHRGRKWAELAKQLQRDRTISSQDTVLMCAAMPGFERERTLRLLGHVTAEALTPDDRSPARTTELLRWAATTFLFPVNVPFELDPAAGRTQFAPYSFEGTFQQSRARAAGTALVVALQQYRLLHGEFPPSLRDVIAPELQFFLLDPYTNAMFGYEPQGLPADLYIVAEGRVIPTGQPLLWSAGYGGRGPITELIEPKRLRNGDSEFVIPAGSFVTTNLAWGPGVFTPEVLEAHRIKFINAGLGPW